jgi:hypothetical protein
MPPLLSRRGFCAVSAGALVLPLGASRAAFGAGSEPAAPPPLSGGNFPITEPSLARDIVGASHRDIDKVRALLAEDRGLALATWDWGFGDWESALGAASHTGRKEIAELLLEHGARADLFSLAMLNCVDAVKAVCEAMPGIQRTRGPHGITLLEHADAGEAARVKEYLLALGGADETETSLPITAEEGGRYVGEYSWEDGGADRLIVELGRREGVGILRTGGSHRPLRRTGEHIFSPAGSPQVTVCFAMADGRATGLAIERGAPILAARRVEG